MSTPILCKSEGVSFWVECLFIRLQIELFKSLTDKNDFRLLPQPRKYYILNTVSIIIQI